MKKISVFLLFICAILFCNVSTAFAFYGSASPGEAIIIDNFVDEDGYNFSDTCDNTDFRLSYTFKSGGKYVDSVYIDNGSVYLRVKPDVDASNSVKYIAGKITLTDTRRPITKYYCEIKHLEIVDYEPISIYKDYNSEQYLLPNEYYCKKVDFNFNGYSTGKLHAVFDYDTSSNGTAEYNIQIRAPHDPMFLGHTNEINKAIMNKYGRENKAQLRFWSWPAEPKFYSEGELSLFVKNDEFVYEIMPDNSLRVIKGNYDEFTDTFTFKTKKLGSYVISDKKLPATTLSAGGNNVTPKPPVAPSSVPTPPPSTSSESSKPEETSSISEESSSEESSSEESSTLEQPSSSTPPSQSTIPTDTNKTDTGVGKGIGIGILISLIVVAIVGLVYFIIFKNSRRNYDSWEE